MIAPTTTDIPRPIKNIRHHNPQANLQVGLTSLSIQAFSFLFFPSELSYRLDTCHDALASL
jgi:hypothetical protein